MAKVTHLHFVDVETTAKHGPGKRPLDRVIEIACKRVDLVTREEVTICDTLIWPEGRGSKQDPDHPSDDLSRLWTLGEYHVKEGHFADVTAKQWRDAPIGFDVYRGLARALHGTTIAGNNPAFDLDHLRAEFITEDVDFPELDYHRVDLSACLALAYQCGAIKGMSLRHARKLAGCEGEQKHRAMADVNDAIRVYWWLVETFDRGLMSGLPSPGRKRLDTP